MTHFRVFCFEVCQSHVPGGTVSELLSPLGTWGEQDQRGIWTCWWETSFLSRDCLDRPFVHSFTHPSFAGQTLTGSPPCTLHRTRRRHSQESVISQPQGSGLVEPLLSLDCTQGIRQIINVEAAEISLLQEPDVVRGT